MARLRSWTRDHWKVVATFMAVLVLWEIVVRLFGVRAYILPAPTVVLASFGARAGTVANATLYTLQPMLMGYAMAVVIGVGLALIVAFSRTMQAVLYPLIVFLQIVPRSQWRRCSSSGSATG
jgi:NitT/TauT family transport system permease protein